MLPNIEVRHLRAVIVLGEELNFALAADRLHITQSALSRQITELEAQQRFQLFIRGQKRAVQLTDAGRAFVEEACSALLHVERAVHVARTAYQGFDGVLAVGCSPYEEDAWISTILAIRLPLYPQLRVRLTTQFAMELTRSVLAGELSLALVAAPPKSAQITAVSFAQTRLYAAIPETHPAAHKDELLLCDLANDEWILLSRRVHPLLHDTILDTARREGISPKDGHDVFTAQQAVQLVSAHLGVAILPKSTAVAFRAEGVAVKPLSDRSLSFETCLIMRREDDSRMVNEFARAFLRKYSTRHLVTQMELGLSA